MFYLLLFSITIAAGEYFYFSQQLDSQRRQILTLASQNNRLKSKVKKNQSTLSTISIKYMEPLCKSGYTTENSSIFLSPLEDSPLIYKCTRAIKVNVLYSAEILDLKWHEVLITVNSSMLKGWMKESEIVMVVDENYNKTSP